MSEQEHEHEEHEDAEAPVSLETESEVEDEEGEAEAAETPAEEPTEDAEPQEAQQEDWEKRFKAADRAFTTYTRAITKAWGDDATRLVPFVVDPGAPMGFVDAANQGRVPDDIRQNLLSFLGLSGETEYEPDPLARQCSTCKGKGLTATGSSVGPNMTRDCPTCGGLGYEADTTGVANGSARVSGAHTPASEAASPLTTAERDLWGEPRLLPNGERNTNFGLMPDFKTPHPVYGVTAGLGVVEAV